MGSYYDYGHDYGYGYDYGYDYGGLFGGSEFMAALGMFLGFIAVFAVVTWAMGLVVYILRSIGLYKLAENRGMSGAALAWIPIIGFYRIGSVADDIVARNGGKSHYRHILLIGGIVNALCSVFCWMFLAVGTSFLSYFADSFYGTPYSYGYGYGGGSAGYYGGMLAYLGVSSLLSVFAIVLVVFMLIALNKIYKCYRPMNSTSWTVLSVIFPFMQSVYLFILRNAVPADQWGPQGYYPPQNPMPNPNLQVPPPPPYLPYGQQPPVNGGYPMQQQGWQAPPPPQGVAYQPPVAPNPQEMAYQPPIAPNPQEMAYQPPVAPNPQEMAYQPPIAPNPQEAAYQPPVAPNPPEPWEIENTAATPPPRAPWEQNNGDS